MAAEGRSRAAIADQAPLQLSVRAPWLEEIAAGRKRVEGRPGPAARWEAWVGRQATLHHPGLYVVARVVAVRHYATLPAYLAGEGWQAVAPHLGDGAAALAAYRGFYSDDDVEARGGMNALELEVASVARVRR